MAAAELPLEVLQGIFTRLLGHTVVQCRAVCTRWRDAVDGLSDADWHLICANDMDMRGGYEKAVEKHGLSWYDTFKSLNTWSQIAKAKMNVHKLNDHVTVFKVLPGGIVSFPVKRNKNEITRFCDTVVYCDTDTGQECDRQEYDFCFDGTLYDENRYLQVFVLEKKNKLCIIVKETKKKYTVGSLHTFTGVVEMTLIGKNVYFKNSEDNIIYRSRINAKNVLKTKCLEAFEENHDNFDAETIIGFSEKEGEPVFISDEGSTWRANIYEHQNADLGFIGEVHYDENCMFGSLQDCGIDWRTNWTFKWICSITNIMNPDFSVFANDAVIVASFGKTINIYRAPYFIPGIRLLKSFLKQERPIRKITLTKELLKGAYFPDVPINFVTQLDGVQLDVIETPTSHKVIAKLWTTLYVFDFKPTESTDTKTKAVKKTLALHENDKTPVGIRKRKSTVVAKKKGVKKAMENKHTYATRSKRTMV